MSGTSSNRISKELGSRPSGQNTVFEKRDGIGQNPKPTSAKPGFTKPGSK